MKCRCSVFQKHNRQGGLHDESGSDYGRVGTVPLRAYRGNWCSNNYCGITFLRNKFLKGEEHGRDNGAFWLWISADYRRSVFFRNIRLVYSLRWRVVKCGTGIYDRIVRMKLWQKV